MLFANRCHLIPIEIELGHAKRDLSADFNMPQNFAVLPNFSTQKLGEARAIKIEEICNAFSYVDIFKFSCKNAVGK